MKLGARIIKTGIAITLSFYIATWLHLNPPVYAAVAAIFAVQPSIYRSYQTIIEQIQGNLIGAVFAILSVIAFGNEPIIIGVVSIAIIAVHLKLKIEDTIPLSLVTALVIMETTTQHFITFATTRFVIIMIGVLSAFFVNLMFIPPHYEKKLFLKISETTEEILKWFRLAAYHNENHMALKKEIEQLREDLVRIDQLYSFYKEERHYTKKQLFSKTRKLVIFRQMILTAKKARYLLKDLHHYENDILQLPAHIQGQIRTELENLANFHQQSLLKIIGKTKLDSFSEQIKAINEKAPIIHSLTKLYMEKKITDEMWLHIFPLIGLMVDYFDEIERLDHLAETFHHYHRDTNELETDDAF